MKAFRCCWKNGQTFGLFVAVLLCGAKLFAQTSVSNALPVVTITATTPVATQTNTGVFTVFRQGDTNSTLNLYYDIGGTATNGVDYTRISDWLNIPAGATSNTITITSLVTTASSIVKTVELQLAPSPSASALAPNYEIGSPSNAVVYLQGATNVPPIVSIVAPQNGSVFYTPTNIEIVTRASDPDYITNVEFFAGTNDLGKGSPVVLDPPGINGVTGLVYLFNWLDVPAGDFPLTAVATDGGGASTTSAPVNISVLIGPKTNLPPVVRIVSPANGATFWSPVNISLYAYANDPDGSVSSVEFFDGTNSLGFGRPVMVAEPLTPEAGVPGRPVPLYPTNIFFLMWSNAPDGTNILTALATDNDGAATVSDPVDVTVFPSPPPPTNRPPIVDIVATDPVAIEGTNSWVWPGETNPIPSWAAWPAAVCRFFTNCGPKTATFTVHRFGDTNDDLTVPYSIGGTASNGVDYVSLPGSATILAGERGAQITIVPIDDGPPDIDKTVILTLTPSTNTPPDYRIGWPPRAAAVIIDSDDPRPVAGPLPDGCFHLVLPGPDATWFCLESSTNMVNWASLCTNQVINGSIDFVDPDAPTNPTKFYRAVPLANPPPE